MKHQIELTLDRKEQLDLFYCLLVEKSKIKSMQTRVDNHYAFNKCGQSLLLIETILVRVLQYISLETLFTLCGTSRKLGESLATLVKQHPLKSIACHSTKTLERLRFFWHCCFTAPDMLTDIFKSVHTLRLKVRHDPFITQAQIDELERARLFNGYICCDILYETNVKTLLLEAVEEADVIDFFGHFCVPQKEVTLYCFTDPIKYFGREWLKISAYTIPATTIEDFKGLKYASLQNMTINEG